MIDGRYDGDQPLVDGTALLTSGGARLALVDTAFQLDFRSAVTCFELGGSGVPVPPLDDFSVVSGVAGVTVGFPVRAALSFANDEGRFEQLRIDAFIVQPSGDRPSNRLGRDVLSQWFIVLDAATGTLLMEPLAE